MMDRIDVLERQVQLLSNGTRLPAMAAQDNGAVFPAVGVGRVGRLNGALNTSRQLLESQGDGQSDVTLDPRESVVKIRNVNAKGTLKMWWAQLRATPSDTLKNLNVVWYLMQS